MLFDKLNDLKAVMSSHEWDVSPEEDLTRMVFYCKMWRMVFCKWYNVYFSNWCIYW